MREQILIKFWATHGDREAVVAYGTSAAAVEARYRHVYGVPAHVEVFVGSPVPQPVI